MFLALPYGHLAEGMQLGSGARHPVIFWKITSKVLEYADIVVSESLPELSRGTKAADLPDLSAEMCDEEPLVLIKKVSLLLTATSDASVQGDLL